MNLTSPTTLARAQISGHISVTDVSVVYRQRGREHTALSGANLSVRPGEFVALLGPSGCGKTTLLNTMAGIVQPTTGSVSVDDVVVNGPSWRTGIVFQQHSLFPWMTALENVAFGPRRLGRPYPKETAERCLSLVGLGDFADAYPAALSGGMRQRVGLARALATEPPVLLMDEPFGALDALTRGLMQELLLRIWEKRRPTIVFVTHDEDEAVFLADRVIVMGTKPGRVRADLRVEMSRPRTVDTRRQPQFSELRAAIGQLIRDESQRGFEAGRVVAAGFVSEGAGL